MRRDALREHGVKRAGAWCAAWRAQRQLFAFFDLPEETGDRGHPPGPSQQRGYHGFATRGLAYTLGERTPPDLRETLFLGPVDDHREYYAGLPEAATSYAPNLI